MEINKNLFAKLKTNTPSLESRTEASRKAKQGTNPFDDDIWADEPIQTSNNPFDNL